MLNLKIIIIAGLFLFSLSSEAANRNLTLTNDSATNHIMLWVDDPIDITQVTFLSASMSGWVSTIAPDGNSVDLSGATLTASDPSTSTVGGEFRLRFSFPPPGSATISFQWAELNFDGTSNTLLSSGTFTHGPGVGLTASNTFTHLADIPNLAAPVPLGSPIVLFLSAAAILGTLRRQNLGVNTVVSAKLNAA
jgi:hypothetical protein